jgi:hypothetical protein
MEINGGTRAGHLVDKQASDWIGYPYARVWRCPLTVANACWSSWYSVAAPDASTSRLRRPRTATSAW